MSATTEIETWSEDEVDAFEVHLVYSMANSAPCDEVLTVAAPERDLAIFEARRVSDNNPPEVGPVYNEGDMIPPATCDNADRFDGGAELEELSADE